MRVSVSCATGGGRLFSFILQPVKVKMGGKGMASIIQIFGVAKSFDTKKAERYFKERRIPYQYVDLSKKGMSKGELRSVRSAIGSFEALVDFEKNGDAAIIRYCLLYTSPVGSRPGGCRLPFP